MTFKKFLVIVGLPLFLAACSNSSSVEGTRSSGSAARTTSGLYQLLREAVGLGSNEVPQQQAGVGPELQPGLPTLEIVCPITEVRAGTAHYIFYAPDLAPEPRNVQFQGTLTRTARECEFGQNSVRIKFGFAGRVLVGPKGGSGDVTLPVRAIFSYREGEVAWTKLYNIPVNIPPNERSTFFMFVEEDFEYTVPLGNRLSDYALFIGFDGDAATSIPGAN
jgi:hypothetical protein